MNSAGTRSLPSYAFVHASDCPRPSVQAGVHTTRGLSSAQLQQGEPPVPNSRGKERRSVPCTVATRRAPTHQRWRATSPLLRTACAPRDRVVQPDCAGTGLWTHQRSAVRPELPPLDDISGGLVCWTLKGPLRPPRQTHQGQSQVVFDTPRTLRPTNVVSV